MTNEKSNDCSERREYAKALEEARKRGAIGPGQQETIDEVHRQNFKELGIAQGTMGGGSDVRRERKSQLDRIEGKLDRLLEVLDDDQ